MRRRRVGSERDAAGRIERPDPPRDDGIEPRARCLSSFVLAERAPTASRFGRRLRQSGRFVVVVASRMVPSNRSATFNYSLVSGNRMESDVLRALIGVVTNVFGPGCPASPGDRYIGAITPVQPATTPP